MLIHDPFVNLLLSFAHKPPAMVTSEHWNEALQVSKLEVPKVVQGLNFL